MQKVYSTSESISHILETFSSSLQNKHFDLGNLVNYQQQFFNLYKTLTILQNITVANTTNGSTILIDGYLRIKTFEILVQQGYPILDIKIPVIIYHVENELELDECFRIFNPKRLITLETCKTVLFDLLNLNFRSYIKPIGCKSPHFSLDNLEQNINIRNIPIELKNRNVTIQEFFNKILQLNSYIQNNIKPSEQLCPHMKGRLLECEKKATKNDCNICFLGIWRRYEWLDITLYLVKHNQIPNISMFVIERTKIPISIRELVWKKTNTTISDVGHCSVCNEELRYSNMECSHIVAKALGGEDYLENLMPCCKSCNRDMGIMNLLEYKQLVNNRMH